MAPSPADNRLAESVETSSFRPGDVWLDELVELEEPVVVVVAVLLLVVEDLATERKS